MTQIGRFSSPTPIPPRFDCFLCSEDSGLDDYPIDAERTDRAPAMLIELHTLLRVGQMTRNIRRRHARSAVIAILAAHFAATHPGTSTSVYGQQTAAPATWSQPQGAYGQTFLPDNNPMTLVPGQSGGYSATVNSGGLPAAAGNTAAVLNTIEMPAAFVSKVSTTLEMKYRDQPGIHISPDVRSSRLVILAPGNLQQQIQADAMRVFVAESQPGASNAGISQAGAAATPAAMSTGVRTAGGAMQVKLTSIDWRQFEDSLQIVAGKKVPVTTSQNGERSMFQLTGVPLDGTTIEVNRRENMVTVVAPEPSMPGWQKMIRSIDQTGGRPGEVVEMIRVENAKPAPIQRAMRLLDQLPDGQSATIVPAGPRGGQFQATAFQNPAQPPAAQPNAAQPPADPNDPQAAGGEEAAGMIGDTQIQFVPELGIIIVRGAKKDTQRVLDVIKQIEDQSVLTQPEVEVVMLKHLDNTAAATLLRTLYTDVLAARQGEVNITALDQPNALLLIGRREALANAMSLIEKLDQPLDASSKLRVFRLDHASATDAELVVRNFFVDRPGQGEDVRPGLGSRVRILADYRTNSLIVGAAPRDLNEVAVLLKQLDVESVPAQDEIKVFPLRNSLAADLAPVLQTAINGEGDATIPENTTRPSKTLSLLSLDAQNGGVLNSGLLTGVVVTADANANALIVRGPISSMSLIAELIRQLDQVPGVESVVKVFTVENGDALKLTTSLQTLFAPATGQGGAGGGGGIAGQLAPATASSSSLVNLRFSTDQRTNSIIATGSSSDLEVVESILLRLDTAGFAERITEVIWLRHQSAPEIAAAIQTYVQQRTQTRNLIDQFAQGQGLGPFDLPDRDLVVVAEPVSNSLLLSVSPRLYDDVRRLIENLDRRPPMVLIKVVLAEVTLSDAFELGGELGLQDSLLFDRGRALPANLPNSTPGFGFNNNGTPNVSVAGADSVASRAVSTFGLGATSTAAGYGGFVLSAASESFSFLLRSLQDAGRAQILSRPQIMTVDNKAGFINVGQLVSRPSGLQQGQLGTPPLLVVADIEVGLTLEVLPRVGADGLISMLILARRSDVDRTPGTGTAIGSDLNGIPIIVPDINETRAESTIVAYSGQTVVFGGLIQKERAVQSRRVPYLSQIPLLGVMFRFDRETERRSELLIVMTPMLINGDEDLEYVKQVESSRMSYCLADVVEMHGDVGLSGGYGLWGPAIGPTIYPDLHPTVDQFPRAVAPEIYGEPIYNGSTIIETPMGEVPSAAPQVPLMQNGVPAGSFQQSQPAAIQSGPPTVPGQSVSTPSSSTQRNSSQSTRPGETMNATNQRGQLSTGNGITAPAGATSQPGRLVKPANFKFIDSDMAAELSGISNK
jgi:type II secretory pathway component GspD/PulD (secretin)